jgi:hypothetical protein
MPGSPSSERVAAQRAKPPARESPWSASVDPAALHSRAHRVGTQRPESIRSNTRPTVASEGDGTGAAGDQSARRPTGTACLVLATAFWTASSTVPSNGRPLRARLQQRVSQSRWRSLGAAVPPVSSRGSFFMSLSVPAKRHEGIVILAIVMNGRRRFATGSATVRHRRQPTQCWSSWARPTP